MKWCLFCALFVSLVATPLTAQWNSPQSWRIELTAGATTDVLARGPWVATDWRRSFWGRVGISLGASLAYEYAIEPLNHQTNAGRWDDVAQRLAGTLALEVVWAGVRRVVR